MIYDLKTRNKRGRHVAPPPPGVVLSPQLRGGQSCETRPRGGSRWSVAGRRLYKQTQFGVFRSDEECHCVQTKPICPRRMGRRGRGWSLLRQTNPIPAVAAFGSPHCSSIPSFHHASPMPILPNKANSPGGAGLSCTNKPNLGQPEWGPQGNSAEQSRFRQSAGGARGEMCQTKPNLGKLGYLGADARGEPVAPNKANSLRRSSAGRGTMAVR
jgi:hypothetical protein